MLIKVSRDVVASGHVTKSPGLRFSFERVKGHTCAEGRPGGRAWDPDIRERGYVFAPFYKTALALLLYALCIMHYAVAALKTQTLVLATVYLDYKQAS